MRDPARIEVLLDLIADVWRRHPDYRLAQLLINAANPSEPCPEVYHLEDDELAKKLEAYRSTYHPD